MDKVIEHNEFGIKRTDNLLCLVCRKYIMKRLFKKHIKTHEKESH